MAIPADDSPYTSLRISSSLEMNRHRSFGDHDAASESFLKHSANDSFPPSQKAISLARRSQLEIVLAWVRWIVIVLLQFFIITLLLPVSGFMGDDGWAGKLVGGFRNGSEAAICSTASSTNFTQNGNSSEKPWILEMTEVGGDVNGLYVTTSKTHSILKPDEDKYIPNMMTNSTRMEIRANWDKLVPLGSGFISIPDSKSYPRLGKPLTNDPLQNGTLFEASWTHAIRCLYYTMDSYHQLLLAGGTDKSHTDGNSSKNMTHCFEYLRNHLLCTADMALEGDGTNSGSSHMCRDREQATKWIEDRRANDLQSITGLS
ncbi:hypothetical protein K3495_g2498 [Podosphaera aphanis]|nr:hypothetical protein K3495_g2498 [Podosphaera aphanis]